MATEDLPAMCKSLHNGDDKSALSRMKVAKCLRFQSVHLETSTRSGNIDRQPLYHNKETNR